MVYNMTNITEANTIVEIITETNSLSNDLLFSVFFLIIFLSFLIIFKQNSFKTVLLADAFFMSVLGIIFFTLGWIGQPLLILPIILLFGSLVMYYFVQD